MERMMVQGNHAVGWGAVLAGCNYFFGYPITPQNEIPEWFSEELPKRDGVYVQAQSEIGAINMVYGAAAGGARVITSTSGPGWSLMQETMSHLSVAELPCVVVLIQRGGPGAGVIRHAQMDYLSATRGGGHGEYHNIVLAPASVQETCDSVQLAFYLADKYRNPVVVLSDAIIGQSVESAELSSLGFGHLLEKDWALGTGIKGKKSRMIEHAGFAFGDPTKSPYMVLLQKLHHKFQEMASEVKFESYQTEDAELVLIAFGYVARVCKEAILMAREEGPSAPPNEITLARRQSPLAAV